MSELFVLEYGEKWGIQMEKENEIGIGNEILQVSRNHHFHLCPELFVFVSNFGRTDIEVDIQFDLM